MSLISKNGNCGKDQMTPLDGYVDPANLTRQRRGLTPAPHLTVGARDCPAQQIWIMTRWICGATA